MWGYEWSDKHPFLNFLWNVLGVLVIIVLIVIIICAGLFVFGSIGCAIQYEEAYFLWGLLALIPIPFAGVGAFYVYENWF